jgi:c-di-GMP-binding flagellar brake protein YcgR
MLEERRSFKRFDIPLDIEFKISNSSREYVMGRTVNFSRTGLCLESNAIVPDVNDVTELKIKLPEKDIYTTAVCDVAWQKRVDDKFLMGIKLMAMDKEAKNEILQYAYDLWLKKMRGHHD